MNEEHTYWYYIHIERWGSEGTLTNGYKDITNPLASLSNKPTVKTTFTL